MARPRRAQPAPSWASSSRMTKPTKAASTRTHTTHTTRNINTNLQVVLYDRPRYVAGVSSVPSGPITLVPPRDSDAYIVDKVVTPFDGWGAQAATAEAYDTDEEDARYAADPARRTVQRVLNYVVGWPDEPYARELVPCTQILDYVSPYTLEAYEYELCERQRQRRETPHFKVQDTETGADKMGKMKSGKKNRAKKKNRDKRTEDANAEKRTAQQRDRDGKFLGKGALSTPSTTATSTQMSQIAQIKLDSPVASLALSPNKRASLSQPVVSLSIPLSSLSPSKQRTAQGLPQTQPTLSLKRPYDKFVDEAGTTTTATPTETETESVSEDDDDDDEDEDSGDDELYVSLPRVTPIPPPTFAVLSASSASASASAPTSEPKTKPKPTLTSTSTSTSSSSSSSRKITRVSPPRVIGMRSEALHKRVKVEDAKAKGEAKTEKTEKTEKAEKREPRVTPIPPPVYHHKSKPKPHEQPPQEPQDPEEDLYEVDRLEGDCYTHIDDDDNADADADGAAPQDGMPVPKKLVQYFYVRWKGDWPPDQNPTWEPAENLPPRMVQQYLQKLARQEHAPEQSQLASQLGQDHRQQEELLGLSSDDDDDNDNDDNDNDDVAPMVFSDITT